MSTKGSSKGSENSRKNASGSRTDPGWEHGYDVVGNSRKVKCKYCDKIVNGDIFRFKHHLACTRRDAEACISVPNDVRKKMLSLVCKIAQASETKKRIICSNEDSSDSGEEIQASKKRKGKATIEEFIKVKKGSSQATINLFMKKDIREEACQQIARFFYTSAIPFNCAKNPEFTKMFEIVGKYGCGFKPPSYHELWETFLKKEVDRTMTLLEEHRFMWKKKGCSIMSDGWTDKKRRSICNFLVNSEKGTIFLQSTDTSDISKTADKVFEMLNEIVDKVGEQNVVQIITDNAANYKAAGEMLMCKRKCIFWTPCAAHCIDLMLEDFEKKLKIHEVTISKARRISTFIYSRTLLIFQLRKCTKGRDIIRPAVTRFATAYLSLNCINELKSGLQQLFTSDFWKTSRFSKIQEGKFVQKTILDGRFWRNVVTCLKAASPLIKALRLVDSEELAMGFIYKAMEAAKEKIKVNFGGEKILYEPVWKIINERWKNQLHHPLHAAGYFLNPVYQYSLDFEADSRVKNGLYDCMERMIDDRDVRSAIHAQLESFKKAKGLFGRDAAKLTIGKKSPAEWWDSFGDDCPELQNWAIRILSLTCSSSGCERNWSAFEMVHTKKRNRLHQKKMNDLVFVYYNLKMQGKKSKEVSQTPTTLEEFPSDDEWITEAPSSAGLNLVDEDYDANINNDPLELINLVDDVDNLEDMEITSAHVGVESNIGDKDAIGCDNEIDGTDDFDAEDEDEDRIDDLDVTMDDLS
ncbi:uncharacterized protein LOC122011797 [Zingiber officinale]|uniref:uncharacterized protein LOC122011797 n=1 Tax=Zingiber officinale TaxID=94328 RepID=UPI001C4D3844|nr:uncharacterized protein LOC122011797 [Zingiber officinale]